MDQKQQKHVLKCKLKNILLILENNINKNMHRVGFEPTRLNVIRT